MAVALDPPVKSMAPDVKRRDIDVRSVEIAAQDGENAFLISGATLYRSIVRSSLMYHTMVVSSSYFHRLAGSGSLGVAQVRYPAVDVT